MATVALDQFASAAASGSAFWTCAPCTMNAHVSNGTLGVNDSLYVMGSVLQGKVQASQFAGKQVSYTWGFTTCSPPQGWQTIVISEFISADSRGFQDNTANCPSTTTVSNSGTMNIGSDGIVTLTFSPMRNYGNLPDPAYYNNWVLQLTSNAADTSASSAASASSSTGASTTASSSASASVSVSLSGSVTIPITLSGSALSNLPSITPSWAPGQSTALPGGGSQGIGSPTDGSSDSSSNKAPIIGGAAAGAVVAIAAGLILFWLFFIRRRRAREEEEEGNEEHRIEPLDHDESGWGGGPGAGMGKAVELQESRYDLLRSREKNPAMFAVATAAADDPSSDALLPNSSAPQPAPESSRRPPSAIFSTTGLPTYDSHENANMDPLFLSNMGDQHGPYTLDDTFQVHDLLGEWAEEHRDAIPYHLERRLRIGGYTPGTHPNEIAQEVWLRRFAVTRFELAGLVELFERTNGMPTRQIPSSASEISDD